MLHCLLIVVLCDGCIKSNQASTIKHDWGDLVASDLPWFLWQEFNYNEVASLPSLTQPWPEDAPVARRLQTWLDAFYATLKGVSPDLLRAPALKALVVHKNELNANPFQVDVCVDADVKLINTVLPSGPIANPSGVLLFDGRNDLKVYPHVIGSCVHRQMRASDVLALAQWFVGERSSCFRADTGIGGRPTLTIDVPCLPADLAALLASYPLITELRYHPIANYLLVDDGSFKGAGEEQMVFMLAHEAAHYYRGHPFSEKSGGFNFFYTLGSQNNFTTKPTPLTADEELATLGTKATEGARKWLEFYPVAGQQLHSALFTYVSAALSSISGACQQNTGCIATCTNLAALFAGSTQLTALVERFPTHNPLPNTPEAGAFYQDYERRALQCFQMIATKDAARAIKFLGNMGVTGIEQLLPPPESRPPSFDALILLVSAQLPTWIDAQNNSLAQLFRDADSRRLGYYTVEQEADEIGLELSVRVGMAPENAIDFFINILAASDEAKGWFLGKLPGELSREACAKAYQNGFPQFIPIANYGDSHHSDCFRAYNMFREIRAHQDQLNKARGSGRTAQPDPALWQNLRQSI